MNWNDRLNALKTSRPDLFAPEGPALPAPPMHPLRDEAISPMERILVVLRASPGAKRSTAEISEDLGQPQSFVHWSLRRLHASGAIFRMTGDDGAMLWWAPRSRERNAKRDGQVAIPDATPDALATEPHEVATNNQHFP